jgi:hypothetical protein
MIKKTFLGFMTLAVASVMLAAPPTTTPGSPQTETQTTHATKHKKAKKNKSTKKEEVQKPPMN